MSIIDRVNALEAKVGEQQAVIKDAEKKTKFWKMKIPGKIKRAVMKDNNRAAAFFIGPNRMAEWRVAFARDGLWYVEGEERDAKGEKIKDSYAYEEAAVFHLKQGKNKLIPVIILFSWRLTPAGGKAEEAATQLAEKGIWNARLVGGQKDEIIAELAGLKKFGQQTIIRGIQQAEIEKNMPKKSNFGWLIWIGVGLAALYVIMKLLGKA